NMLVMKFGGASVATPESFLKIAELVIERSLRFKKVVVVVSAMGNTTDQLLELARKVNPNPPKREEDMLVSVGERISIALLAMAMARKGKEAVSFTGSQSGIITCENHSDARIIDVKPKRLEEVLAKGQVGIVAGFQGVSRKGEITTLGRGGSDTSAVALAVALGAPKVEFYKDVEGVYNTDPKKDAKAQLLSQLSYADALQIAENGAKVLHARCIQLAEKNGVQLAVHSFQKPAIAGTIIGVECNRNSYTSYEEPICLRK
ncbi:MAG TPA: aspartate kinase, partial [Chlamydiales bacterium]|nr:aspartate kinase [Chlamydiales bacterium]